MEAAKEDLNYATNLQKQSNTADLVIEAVPEKAEIKKTSI